MKEKKYLVLGIVLVLLTFVGVSLAYFLTTIEGDRKNITINTSDLRVIFTNGDAIEGTEIEPGWSVSKTFSVENKTKNEYKYNIVIEDLINTFKTTGYLQYKITSTDGGYNMADFEDVPKRNSATDTVLAYSVSIPSKSIQNYTITIHYKNDENVDQSIDSLNNAVVTGNIYISKGTPMPTLTEAILRDNPTISERTDFSITNTVTTTGTIYQTNKTEDGSTVHYYSGNTTNNWVKFGKTIQECTYNGLQVYYGIYNEETSYFKEVRKVASSDECVSTNVCLDSDYGPIVGLTEEQCGNIGDWRTNKATAGNKTEKDIYWRIIRTNEDGSVRMLYSGLDPATTRGFIGGSVFNLNYNDPMYVGYMYGTSGSLENNRTNTNESTIKTVIDTWYKNTLLTNYDKYISKTAIYCNDRSIASDQTYSTSSAFNYGPYTRLVDNKTPTYKCGGDTSNGLFESTQAVADKFSASTASGGNGQLKYPIALMTADESAFIGGKYSEILSRPFLWYYTNSQGESITGTEDWWLISPHDKYIDNMSIPPFNSPRIFGITGQSHSISEAMAGKGGIVSSEDDINRLNAIRPVISLSSCVKITGSGTPDDPYIVDYENSCK